MYYTLLVSPLEDYGIIQEPPLPLMTSFLTGAIVTDVLPAPLVFQVDATAQHPPTDYMEIKTPVFSHRLVKTLSELGVDNLQLFEARLENRDTRERWDGYNAVNIVGLVSCLALEASGATPSLPPLYSFDESDLVIHETRTGGALLFRLAESPDVILIDRRIGDHLMDATPEFRGIEFRDVESI